MRLRLALAALLFCSPALAQVKSKAAIQGEINANLPNNTVGLITPSVMRSLMTDVINSYFQGAVVNAQTGTSYTAQCSDMGALLTFNNAAPVAVTLPSAATACFNSNWAASFKNNGAGTVTLTPATGTINGAANVALLNGQGLAVVSDGTNWQSFGGFATQTWAINGSNISYSAGNVSIGTASPTAQLDTTGTVRHRSITSGCLSADASGNVSSVACAATPTAAAVTYTPQGTGGVATTVAAELNRTIWANDYGAVCNGSTDDHVAIQNAINQAQTAGLPLRGTGVCAIASTLNVTAKLDFAGAGNFTIVGTSTAINLITITTPNSVPVYLHDLYMSYSGTAAGGTAAVLVTGTASNENSGSHFERLNIGSGSNVGISFVKASVFTVSNNIISANAAAIIVANGNNGDSGDSTIYGNFLQATAGGAGIIWNSSGGIRIENNKVLGNNLATGIQFFLSNGVNTSDIFVIGNSIEGIVVTTGNNISFSRAGTTGSLARVIISGNELGGGQVCVNVPNDVNGTWLSNIIIQGNSCITTNTTTAFGFIVNSTTTISILNNALENGGAAASATPTSIGAGTATNCVVGLNVKQGTWAASSTSSCTTVAPI